jgi:hypothetical protein
MTETYTLEEYSEFQQGWIDEIVLAKEGFFPPYPTENLVYAIGREFTAEDVEAAKTQFFEYFRWPVVYCVRCQAEHRIIPSDLSYDGCYPGPDPFILCSACGGHHMPPDGSCRVGP